MSIGSSRNRSRKGFTLVELAGGRRRRRAADLDPASLTAGKAPPRREHRPRAVPPTIGQIQGSQIYAAQNKGFIPGSMTSGKFLFLDKRGTDPRRFPQTTPIAPGSSRTGTGCRQSPSAWASSLMKAKSGWSVSGKN